MKTVEQEYAAQRERELWMFVLGAMCVDKSSREALLQELEPDDVPDKSGAMSELMEGFKTADRSRSVTFREYYNLPQDEKSLFAAALAKLRYRVQKRMIEKIAARLAVHEVAAPASYLTLLKESLAHLEKRIAPEAPTAKG